MIALFQNKMISIFLKHPVYYNLTGESFNTNLYTVRKTYTQYQH